MKKLLSRIDALRSCDALELRITHLAKGSFGTGGNPQALPVNRFFTILSNPNGSENYISDGHGYRETLAEGKSYFIPADLPTVLKLDTKLKFLSIQFNLNLYSAIDIFSGMEKYLSFENREFAETFSDEVEHLPPERLGPESIRRTWDFSCRILRSEYGSSRIAALRKFEPYRKAIDYISSSCDARLRVSDLAKLLYMPKSVFSRKFSADTGITPKKFVEKQLLKKSMELLNNPANNVKTTAFALKFRDEFIFSRFFRSVSGMPPMEYRRKQGVVSSSNRK